MGTNTPPPPPPPSGPPPGGPAKPSSARPWYRRAWVGWVGGSIVGLLIGVAGAGTPEPDETDTAAAAAEPAPAETITVTSEPEPAETVTVEGDAEPEPAETVTVTETVEAATPDDQAADSGGGDVLAAGQWQFSDVQIRQDNLGDFEVRARATNTGGNVEAVIWTATIFVDGSVAATAQTSANDVAAGSTTTQTFITTDDYVAGPYTIEFQVDNQF